MQTSEQIEHKLKTIKPFLIENFSVSKIGYFGSYANEEQNEQSDLDLLVEFSRPIGWSFFTLEQFLEERFGVKVDLVTPQAIKAPLKENILQQVRFV
ncbi:MAG: nucleotidyltransferase family protein [Ignavibacteriales bacterium]|nr:nucleotidyltransferase family protein [Ignavibacteriales bacterium]